MKKTENVNPYKTGKQTNSDEYSAAAAEPRAT